MDEAWVSAAEWVKIEHMLYEGGKFEDTADDALTAEEWEELVTKYLHRAKVLGLDNPLGRQAVGKAATTAVAYLETCFRVYGSVPVPGFPSGHIRGEFRSGEETSPGHVRDDSF